MSSQRSVAEARGIARMIPCNENCDCVLNADGQCLGELALQTKLAKN